MEKIASIKFRGISKGGRNGEECILINSYNIVLQIEVRLLPWISSITQITVDLVFLSLLSSSSIFLP